MTPQEQYNQVATYGGALKDPNDIRKIAQRAFELNKDRLYEQNKATGGVRDTSQFGPSQESYVRMIDNALTGKLYQEDPALHSLAQQAVDEYKMNIIPRTPETGPGSQYLRGGQEPTTPPTAQQWNITPGQAPTPITPTGMPSIAQPQAPQQAQTAQQWNITPGQSPTPIKPPTGANDPGSIGDSGQNQGAWTPPNQDKGLARNLSAEQQFVKNWAGKGGRLPTSAEINQAVYGTQNPSFNTVQNIQKPVQTTSAPSTPPAPPVQQPPTQQQQSGFQISPDYKASDYSSITGQAPITPPQSSQSGVDAAQKAYEEALGYKPLSAEETEAQRQRDQLDAQARAIAASRDLGLVGTEGQAVAMPFITGQQAQIQKQAAAQIGAISAQEMPLEQKLARLQATRETQRQASLDISKSRLEAERLKASAQTEAAKLAQDQAFREKELATKGTIEQNAGIDLILKGYTKITSPDQLKGLSESDITRVGNDIYRKPVAEKKFTEVSPGATLYDPATGKQVFTAPTAKQLGGVGGGGGGSGGAGAEKGLHLTPAQINSTVNSIAGAFDNEPIVKSYNVTQEGYQTVDSIGVNTKSPADDIAFIYAFAKIMDPNSVVREGEYATIQKYAQTWADNFGFKAQRIFSNTNFLSSDAKQKMLNALKPKVDTISNQYKNLKGEYQRQINDAYAGSPRQITSYELGTAPEQPQQKKVLWGPGVTESFNKDEARNKYGY